jgi:hypothetical protein
MPRYAALGLVVLAGCIEPKTHDCASDGTSWVCPSDLACAEPPTYCANPTQVGACDNMPDGSPCRTDVVPDGICVDDACQMCTVDIEGCRQIGWNPMTVPNGGTYDVVYATGSGDAWAGGATTLVHYDGAHWEPDATFPTLTGGIAITGIAGTSSAHLFVNTSGGMVYHLVGGAWTSTTTAEITHAVWAPGDDEAFAVGLVGDVEHFDGSAWTQLTATGTTSTLSAVWGTSATNVYAAGRTGAVIHYNGTSWSASSAGSGNLATVWGSGPSDIYVGGTTGIYHSPDGATWTNQAGDDIVSIWGDSSTDVFAGSAGGISRSDGTGLWVPLVSPQMVSSISGSGPADAFAAAGTQVLRYTGLCWSEPLSPPASGYASGWATAPNMLFGAGNGGALDQFDGSAWSESLVGINDWVSVWASGSDDAYAINGDGSAAHWDASSWQFEPTAMASPARVSGNGTAVYAAGTGLVQESAGTWSELLPTTDVFTALWVAPDDGVFLVNDALSSYANGALHQLLAGNWNAIWGLSSNDLYVAGAGGQILHYDGTSWSAPMQTGTSVTLNSIWGTSDDDIFAAGEAGTLIHFHAGLWSTVPPLTAGFTGNISAVTGAGATIYVLGPNATAWRLIESAP